MSVTIIRKGERYWRAGYGGGVHITATEPMVCVEDDDIYGLKIATLADVEAAIAAYYESAKPRKRRKHAK